MCQLYLKNAWTAQFTWSMIVACLAPRSYELWACQQSLCYHASLRHQRFNSNNTSEWGNSGCWNSRSRMEPEVYIWPLSQHFLHMNIHHVLQLPSTQAIFAELLLTTLTNNRTRPDPFRPSFDLFWGHCFFKCSGDPQVWHVMIFPSLPGGFCLLP